MRISRIKSVKNLIWILAVLVSLTLLGAPRVDANQEPVCTDDPSTALIFVGTLVSLTPDASRRNFSTGTFQVSELLQGEIANTISIPTWVGPCYTGGKPPVVGSTYLVTTSVSPSGTPQQLYGCERLVPVENATAQIQYLRSSHLGSTPTEVSGLVAVEIHGSYPGKNVPVPGAKIQLTGSGQRFDFVSADDGTFHGAIPAGKYVVATDFPTGYQANYPRHFTITVIEHRCSQITLDSLPTASISAHIADSDGDPLGPMSNVQLTLETAEGQEFVQSLWPDENSNLEASNLLPGRYILGLNTYLPVTRSGAPYPPTYFPGVAARSDAQVITLNPGEHKVLSQMLIKKGQACEIPVRVMNSNGDPSPLTMAEFAYRDYPAFQIGPGDQLTDEDGRTVVYAVFPGPVFLRAERRLSSDSRQLSEIVEVRSCPVQPVTIKLSRTVVDPPESQTK